MPAKSKAQRRFMAIAEHHPEKLRGKMPDMSREEMHKFASTKEKKLPKKTKSKKSKKSSSRFSGMGQTRNVRSY